MRFSSRRVVLAVLAGLALSSGAVPGAARAAGTPAWHRVYRSLSQYSQLMSVAAISARDAWAAGYTSAGALVMHWNGTRWAAVSIPGAAGLSLTEVQATPASGIWMFGNDSRGSEVIVHGDGSHWARVPLPAYSNMASAAVLGPSDMWRADGAACMSASGGPWQCSTSLYHWDGAGWSQPYQIATQIVALSGSGPGNVWAIGESNPSKNQRSYTLTAYRWNGTAWARVAAMPGPRASGQPGIDAASPASVWVSYWPATANLDAVALHWNGHTWQTIRSPQTVATSTDTVADGRGGVWLGPWAHWTGTRWVDTSPGLAFTGNGTSIGLAGLAVIPGTASLWGVGLVSPSPGSHVRNALIGAYGPLP